MKKFKIICNRCGNEATLSDLVCYGECEGYKIECTCGNKSQDIDDDLREDKDD